MAKLSCERLRKKIKEALNTLKIYLPKKQHDCEKGHPG